MTRRPVDGSASTLTPEERPVGSVVGGGPPLPATNRWRAPGRHLARLEPRHAKGRVTPLRTPYGRPLERSSVRAESAAGRFQQARDPSTASGSERGLPPEIGGRP